MSAFDFKGIISKPDIKTQCLSKRRKENSTMSLLGDFKLQERMLYKCIHIAQMQ